MKKFLSVLLSLAMLMTMIPSFTFATASAEQARVNLAYGKSTSSSGSFTASPGYTAAQLTTGAYSGDRWASSSSNPGGVGDYAIIDLERATISTRLRFSFSTLILV